MRDLDQSPSRYNPAYGTYNLSGGLLTTGIEWGDTWARLARGSSRRRAGPTSTAQINLGGLPNAYDWSTESNVATPGTYNLNGGLLQTMHRSSDRD